MYFQKLGHKVKHHKVAALESWIGSEITCHFYKQLLLFTKCQAQHHDV